MRNITELTQTKVTTETIENSTFHTLYKRYLPLVHRICYRYTKNREESDDLAQEVFLKVYSSYTGFEGQSQASTWLYRVATNHCLDHLRANKRQNEILANYTEDLLSKKMQEDAIDSPVKRLMRRLMEDMNEINRQVVFLRFEVGLTHDEIAEICGVSRVAITKRLTKFQAKLILLKAELSESMESVCTNGMDARFASRVNCEDASEEN